MHPLKQKKDLLAKVQLLTSNQTESCTGSYFSQFYDVAQVNQDIKGLLLRE